MPGLEKEMREFIVENLTNTEALSVTVILMNNIIALIVSFFIMFIYKISYVGTAYSRKFNISIGTITIITAMIMSIISNNIALSLGMVGALSIIRFRTAVKDVRDATYIFWAIAAGIGYAHCWLHPNSSVSQKVKYRNSHRVCLFLRLHEKR